MPPHRNWNHFSPIASIEKISFSFSRISRGHITWLHFQHWRAEYNVFSWSWCILISDSKRGDFLSRHVDRQSWLSLHLSDLGSLSFYSLFLQVGIGWLLLLLLLLLLLQVLLTCCMHCVYIIYIYYIYTLSCVSKLYCIYGVYIIYRLYFIYRLLPQTLLTCCAFAWIRSLCNAKHPETEAADEIQTQTINQLILQFEHGIQILARSVLLKISRWGKKKEFEKLWSNTCSSFCGARILSESNLLLKTFRLWRWS